MLSCLKFPALAIEKQTVSRMQSLDELTRCSKVALGNGYYNGLLLVGCDGVAIIVKTARKLHGIGPLWGYNIFLNQRIRVELIPRDESFEINLEDLKGRVLSTLKRSHGWQTRGDFSELTARIMRSISPEEIVLAFK